MVRRVLLIGVANIVAVVLLFALLEGAASLLFIGNEILRAAAVPEHRHAEHDEILGWVNRPGVHLEDYYGPGVDVRINRQRFRNDREFSRTVPPGRTRIVCSGDSFTFGYGVAHDDTWCQRLAALEPRVETVNMGLGGYGVDQAYLWYMRDGVELDHQLHLLAFIASDFRRMGSDRFMGYGKPLMAVRDDSLAIVNRPVPRTSWFTRRRALHAETISRLNLVRLARKLPGLDGRTVAPEEAEREAQRVRDVASRIFADLERVNREKGSRLVLVFLPGPWDYGGDPGTEPWRAFVEEEARRQGIPYVDLVEEIRRVPPTEVDALYAPNDHFSVAGNAWTADVLHRRLRPYLEPSPAGQGDPEGP